MKRQNNFKALFLGITVMATVTFVMPSCDNQRTDDNDRTAMDDNRDRTGADRNNRRAEDSKDIAEERNDAILDNRQDQKDAEFLVEAAEITLTEIHLGQLAQTKSTDAEVKRIGKMMESDHTKSLNELKALASKKGITIPTSLTEDGKDEYNKLNDKKESEFNEDYCDIMSKEHKRAINKFERASKNAEDDEIKAWATAALPKLRTHLEHADMCQEKDKNNKRAASVLNK
ncbi:MAG: DUF4142 domain-containing protein [Bacteroidota bacterium]